MADKPKTGNGGRAAVIAAIFLGLSGLVTAVGGQVAGYMERADARAEAALKAEAAKRKSAELKVRANHQVQQAYRELRAAMALERKQLRRLAEKVNALRSTARILASFHHTPVPPVELHVMPDELDVLVYLPEEVPYPTQTTLLPMVEAELRGKSE